MGNHMDRVRLMGAELREALEHVPQIAEIRPWQVAAAAHPTNPKKAAKRTKIKAARKQNRSRK